MTQKFPAKRIENVCSYKHLYVNIYSSVIQNIQKVETTPMPINGQTDERNVIESYNGVLFGNKKKEHRGIFKILH